MKGKRVLLLVLSTLVLGLVALCVFGPVTSPMPLWMSVLPPLVAIVMALLIKEVISSLFLGVLTGTFLMALYSGQNPVEALGGGILRVVDTYVVGSLNDFDHIQIIVLIYLNFVSRMVLNQTMLFQIITQQFLFIYFKLFQIRNIYEIQTTIKILFRK